MRQHQMGYRGRENTPQLRRDGKLIRNHPAGFRDSHLHDVAITKHQLSIRVIGSWVIE